MYLKPYKVLFAGCTGVKIYSMAKNGCTKRIDLFFESNTLTDHSYIMPRSAKKAGAAQQGASAETTKTKAPKDKKGAFGSKCKPKPSPTRASSRTKSTSLPKPPGKANHVSSPRDAIAGVSTGAHYMSSSIRAPLALRHLSHISSPCPARH